MQWDKIFISSHVMMSDDTFQVWAKTNYKIADELIWRIVSSYILFFEIFSLKILSIKIFKKDHLFVYISPLLFFLHALHLSIIHQDILLEITYICILIWDFPKVNSATERPESGSILLREVCMFSWSYFSLRRAKGSYAKFNENSILYFSDNLWIF